MKDLYKELAKNQLFFNSKIENIIDEVSYIVKRYKKNEIIANEDEKCTSIGVIVEGEIEIQRIYSNGKYIVLKRLREGDVFGEALIFSKNSSYPATIIAINDSKIVFISKGEFLKLCYKEKNIMENFMVLLSDKVIMLNAKIKSISFKTVRQKVVNYLLEEYEAQKRLEIKLSESKEVIAASLGIPRPSLSRQLIKLKNEEMIDFTRKKIIILDKQRLEEELF